MRTFAIILGLICSSLQAVAQVAPNSFFISFRDKKDSPYSIERPSEFLSQRAIERRTRQSIPIQENDLPVNISYIQGVRSLGVTVLTVSKWFNGITVYTADTSVMQQIRSLPYVVSVLKAGAAGNPDSRIEDKFSSEQVKEISFGNTENQLFDNNGMASNYGMAYNQIHMVQGDMLHGLGYRGAGMMIAILDGGFFMANTFAAFDTLFDNGRIVATRDFVVPGNNVFLEHPHGMEVLSVMGGNLPGQIVGTAPEASYLLLRTEDTRSELIIEEYNWVCGAEMADSAGADIINSSLGYTTFDDPFQNHTCEDMTGNHTPSARGANIAVTKGMIVVNSAGNKGGSSWRCVSTPADAMAVVAVAAVDSFGVYASFSSTGIPNQRVKPNIAAQGKATTIVAPDGSVARANGTSFSSPVIAGMMACLWQALPQMSNQEIIRAVEISASRATNPDTLIGYGIPDFMTALTRAGVGSEPISKTGCKVFPNPFADQLHIVINAKQGGRAEVTLSDMRGVDLLRYKITLYKGESSFVLPGCEQLGTGCYLLQILTSDNNYVIKVVK